MSNGCYGYAVTSEFPLRFRRKGSGEPLEVFRMASIPAGSISQPLVQFTPTPQNPVRADLYGGSELGVYDLVIDGADQFHIDTDEGRIGVVPGPDPVRTEERLWGFPLLLAFLTRGDLPLHGASVDVGGRALLLCAPGKHGKTTLAAGFHKAGYRLLAEDLSCVRLSESAFAFPGPASLRVRHDMVAPLGLVDVERLSADEDRVHFAIAEHRRGTSDQVPLAGVVLLKDEGDRIELQRSDPVDAIRDLWFLSFNLPTPEDRQRCFSALAELCAKVPVWDLWRPMQVEALDDTVATLAELARDGA